MQEHNLEPQADETRTETEKVGVETRLTAEQFWLTWARSDIRAEITDAAIAFAEAFRDKSEAEQSPFAAHNWQHWNEMCKTAQEQARTVLEQNAGLREEIKRLKGQNVALSDTLDFLGCGYGQAAIDKRQLLESELTELRTKLVEQG